MEKEGKRFLVGRYALLDGTKVVRIVQVNSDRSMEVVIEKTGVKMHVPY